MQNNPTKLINYKNYKKGILNFFSKNRRTVNYCLFIFLFVLFYFLIDFSTQSLVAHDEGLYARRSRLIEESYNWLSSPFPGPHHKTLGSYWFIALSIRLFGKNELALRLPSILGSFLCLFISYLIALKVSNKKSAFLSILSLSSMPLWIQYSRYASPDIPFVACILLVILNFLNFLDSQKNITKSVYIFISGAFISTAFFIRSYMVLVPIIGLSPFLGFHLLRNKNIFKTIFTAGIFFGFIPTLISLSYSYQKFGINGLLSLFDFAKKQAIGSVDLNNFLLIPLNFLYLTFPIGLLFIILIFFSKSFSYSSIKYPLLSYCYPTVSLLILLSMSTSYPHYYLFLLPSLSNLFAVKLQSNKLKISGWSFNIKNLLSFLLVLISIVLIILLIYYQEFINVFSYNQKYVLYLVSSILISSYILSIRPFFTNIGHHSALTKFFYRIIIPQYLSLSLLFNFGILGNPNFKTKAFLTDSMVSKIINTNTIYLLNVESKIQTLFSYYLPSSIILKSFDNILMYDYVITSDVNTLETLKGEESFKIIKKFDNHVLLVNIDK